MIPRKIYPNKNTATISLPAAIMKASNLRIGDYVTFSVNGLKQVIVTKVREEQARPSPSEEAPRKETRK